MATGSLEMSELLVVVFTDLSGNETVVFGKHRQNNSPRYTTLPFLVQILKLQNEFTCETALHSSRAHTLLKGLDFRKKNVV